MIIFYLYSQCFFRCTGAIACYAIALELGEERVEDEPFTKVTAAQSDSQPQGSRSAEDVAPGRYLGGVPLFEGLDTAALAAIERASRSKRYGAQEQIIDCDANSIDVFIVVEGRVRVVNYSVSGREIAFDDVVAGGYFGEIAALDGPPRSASVMAVEDTLLLVLPGNVFLQALSRHPDVAFRVMRRLARIVRSADTRIMDLSTLAAQNRVQAEVLRQARMTLTGDDTARITPIPLHSDIASRVSTTRETVARVMNDLARQGIVKRTKNALVITDLDRLEGLVEEVRS